MGIEVESDYWYQLFRDAETVDDGVGDVLVLHLFEHVGDDGGASLVVGKKLCFGLACSQQITNFRGAHLSQCLFVGFGILNQFAVDKTLTVANHPYFAAQAREYDGRGRHTFLGMCFQSFQNFRLVEFPDGRIGFLYGAGGTKAELMAVVTGRHAADIGGDNTHGAFTVAHQEMEAAGGLRGRAVDDGNDVTCDDEAVLASLFGVLRDQALLDDLHIEDIVWR